jgi:hypothetical protein
MHYMILMSEKMTSQKKLGEIKLVPYNKPLFNFQKSNISSRSTENLTILSLS